jgi:hypothetical protein
MNQLDKIWYKKTKIIDYQTCSYIQYTHTNKIICIGVRRRYAGYANAYPKHRAFFLKL